MSHGTTTEVTKGRPAASGKNRRNGLVALNGGAGHGQPRSGDGKVWLIGAGPGDPDLLTRKAEQILRLADVVVHDRLVDAGVLALAAPTARRLPVSAVAGAASVLAPGAALVVRSAGLAAID